jgi:uncharacterized protein
MKKLVILLFILLSVSLAQYSTNERSQFVVRQKDWSTCGAAALASVLDRFSGITSTEEEILELAKPFLVKEINAKGEEEAGLSALSLKKAAEAKGMLAKGFRLDLAQISQYFDNGGLPLIAHVRKPRAHFVVLIAKVKNYFVIGDPSWGRKILNISDFAKEKDFSGVVLLFLPNETNQEKMKKNQLVNIEWAKNSLAKLGIR